MRAERTFLGILALAATEPSAAETDLLQLARSAYVERLEKFSADTNVTRNTFRFDGKVMGAANGRWDRDDGVTYKSQLTYHDRPYSILERTRGPDGELRYERLYGFISAHGAGDGATGSSLLEQTAFELHRRLTKQDRERKDIKNEPDVQERSIFRLNTRQLFAGDPKNERAVQRSSLREEARTEIDGVGVKSFETLRRAARDPAFATDQEALPNGVLLRYAAGEATQSLWSSTLANLVQRRVNRGITPGDLGVTPQLDEESPSVDRWAAGARRDIAGVAEGPLKKRLDDEITRQTEQGKRLADLPWSTVNARFEQEPRTGKEVLKSGDVKGEDSQLRDLRVQLAVLEKAGVDLDEVPSDWKYDEQDAKAKITVDFDEKGRALGERAMSVREQLESYNVQLDAAAGAYADVEKRMGGRQLASAEILRYRIAPETKSVLEINRPPAAALEEVGITATESVRPDRYEDLVASANGGGKFRPITSPAIPIGPVTSVARAPRQLPAFAIGFDDGSGKSRR